MIAHMKRISALRPGAIGRIVIGVIVLVTATAALSACISPLAGNCTPKGGGSAAATTTVKVVSDSQTQGAYQPNPATVQAGPAGSSSLEEPGETHQRTADA